MEERADTAVCGRRGPTSSFIRITKRLFASGSRAAKTRLSHVLQRLAHRREDEEAWALLYRQMWPVLMARNYRLLGTAGNLVEDATQEIFLRLFRYSKIEKELTDPDAFCAYVTVVCRNVVNHVLLQKARQGCYEDRTISDIAKIRSDGARPDQLVEARELIQTMFAQLRGSDRKILELLIEGCDLREIAQRLGLRYFTAGARLCRLRARLAEILAGRAKKRARHRFQIKRQPKLSGMSLKGVTVRGEKPCC